ncbi:MAG: NAD-dependent DNA ligase LigA [Planctomycetes bacterium]|nr:NAD-dependent DNA ligase LigA [Planctomycetota bacterium]
MGRSSPSDRVAFLREEIRRHDHLYYVLGKPEISDDAYDRLFSELKRLEEENPKLRSPDSPTQKVGGAAREEFEPVRHLAPMLSLDSSNKTEEIPKFLQRVPKFLAEFLGEAGGSKALRAAVEEAVSPGAKPLEYVVEPKIDGISVEIVYRNGAYERAVTRGDGDVGEDVTDNLRTVRSLPLKLRPAAAGTALLAARGEAVMLKSEFQKLNRRLVEAGEEPFANPRNATSGAVRQLDPSVTASRPLDVFFYDVLAIEGIGRPATQWGILEFLCEAGLKVPEDRKRVRSEEEILAFHRDLHGRRDEIDYEMDGIVVKLDRLDLREALGFKSRSPRFAYALKFPPRAEKTRVRDIAVQVGRTGTLTPVALLDPVDVGGVTVSRASLHNLDVIRGRDIRIGDLVTVRRAGDVIPDVAEVDVSARRGGETEFRMPSKCPVCEAEVVQDGKFFLCTGGLSCPAQVREAIVHWTLREAADIETLGKKKVEQLADLGLLKDVAGLYRLRKEDLAPLDGWGEKSAENLLEAVEKSKALGGERFLFALGIRHVGEKVAREVALGFPSLDALAKATEEEIMRIEGIGPEIARSLASFFREPRNRELLKELQSLGVRPAWPKPREKKAEGSGPFAGKTVVFTGTLSSMERAEGERLVESLGGKASSSVSKKTDFVVEGEKAGTKADKARSLGVRVLTEAEFLRLAGKTGDGSLFPGL